MLTALPALSSITDATGNLAFGGNITSTRTNGSAACYISAKEAWGRLQQLTAAVAAPHYSTAGGAAGAAGRAMEWRSSARWAHQQHQQQQQLLASFKHMTNLRQLKLATPVRGGNFGVQLLRVLVQLPHLAEAVLPPGLLCEQCCPGVHAALAQLATTGSMHNWEFRHFLYARVCTDGRPDLGTLVPSGVELELHSSSNGARQECMHAGGVAAGRQVLREAAAAASAAQVAAGRVV